MLILRQFAVGPPLPHTEVRIVDPGTLETVPSWSYDSAGAGTAGAFGETVTVAVSSTSVLTLVAPWR